MNAAQSTSAASDRSSGPDDHPRGAFSSEEEERIQARLARYLDKTETAVRKGQGRSSFRYLESWRAIERANELFGFNGWSSRVVELYPDYITEKDGRYDVGVTAVVRVTLKDGTCHEDVGFGSSENMSRKGQALEKAKKEATSDALKRTLRLFGAALGNCLYSKDYAKTVALQKQQQHKEEQMRVHAGSAAHVAATHCSSMVSGTGGTGASAITSEPRTSTGSSGVSTTAQGTQAPNHHHPHGQPVGGSASTAVPATTTHCTGAPNDSGHLVERNGRHVQPQRHTPYPQPAHMVKNNMRTPTVQRNTTPCQQGSGGKHLPRPELRVSPESAPPTSGDGPPPLPLQRKPSPGEEDDYDDAAMDFLMAEAVELMSR